MRVKCIECGGAGRPPNAPTLPCVRCMGSGVVRSATRAPVGVANGTKMLEHPLTANSTRDPDRLSRDEALELTVGDRELGYRGWEPGSGT